MNKREFVLGGGGALLAGGPGLSVAAAVVQAPASIAGKSVSAARLRDWQQRVGEQFAVFGAPANTALVLCEVRANDSDPGLHQFTLLFTRSGAMLGSGAHVLRQENGRALALYLDDCGAAAAGQAAVRAHFSLLA